jgi:glycosyltransferase involved in cell wall biosynthesis
MNPLVTLSLVTYNHERFVRDAVEGALQQSYSPLEIIISDDYSQDRTFQVIQETIKYYSGPHYLRVNRNKQNLGVTAHLNRMIEMSSGELIVLAAGDDISLPDRVAQIVKCWNAAGKKTLAIFSQAAFIDYSGETHGLVLDRVSPEMLTVEWMIRNHPIVHGYGLALSRRLFDLFGPLPDKVIREDIVLPVRAAILEPLQYIETPLVHYRRHDRNLSKTPGVDILTVNDFFDYLKQHAKGHVEICRTWIRDLTTAIALVPERREEWQRLQKYAQKRLKNFLIEDQLIGATPIQRVKILASTLFGKTDIKKLMEWAIIFNFPMFYLYYKRYRRRRLAKNSGAIVQ